ncbi:Fpg/Nei family DNA glycosylase [Streptomyces sp. ISL-10]|uniref:Fpg/Nei family DNA glycosylase n=1 Tax=Streptomyces sp. ISL-10 TaxID=2819172 RepID=UPI001BE5E04A|nr:DNA-formamidopyrimidine glycosylase family protein [Streptomyces sp. ISL-10]MBT2368974.1 Fpg/Nei family DNA glycosylase [Streptomyces sp. ISL-10]
MPELPDVEGFREVLRSCGTGRRITAVDVRDAGVLRGVTVRRLRRELVGRRLGEPRRHGKWLVAPTDGPTVVWHFGMTGLLMCASSDDPVAEHDRLVLVLDDDHRLRYRDQRKLQGVHLAGSDEAVGHILGDLGPDALGLPQVSFLERVAGRRGAVKNVLMDQSVLAGLGNLLSDEILWRARVAPSRPARDLDEAELRRIHAAMGRVLRSAVPTARVPPRRTWLTGRRDDPDPLCPRCGGPLRSDRTGGRRSVWCPACQD